MSDLSQSPQEQSEPSGIDAVDERIESDLEAEYRDLFPPCNHSVKDGDQVLVLDPFRAHVRDYDMGVPAEVETIDCCDVNDVHVAFLVWPSGTGLWVDVENVRVVGS